MARETAEQKLERLTAFERDIIAKRGATVIAGIDEVGRGPLAGPVVTACVSLPLDCLIAGVDDSKKLSEKKREELYPIIMERATYAKTAWIDPKTIDSINILNATKSAMEKCAADFTGDIILIDAVSGISLPCEAISLIHGDAISYMIAATSIVAKVERDRYMAELDKTYPQYAFARNKGYGTAEHISALKEYGPCPEHRLSFIGKFINGGRT